MTSYRERARLLRFMAHPMRLEILTIVRWSEECVCHLSAVLKRPQPYVSQQLAILRKEGLISDHKEGTNVFYGLASGRTADQVAAILDAINGDGLVRAGEGHQHVAGCSCPKCEPQGTCSSAAIAEKVLAQAPI